jgi:hypothetical protein
MMELFERHVKSLRPESHGKDFRVSIHGFTNLESGLGIENRK